MSISADTLRRMNKHIADLASSDDKIAVRAEHRLIRFGAKATDLLMEACNDPNPQVRFRAVWALGRTNDPKAFDTIIKLTEDIEDRVSYDAVMVLGQYRHSCSVAFLIRVIQDHYEEEENRLISPALMALAELGELAVEPLLDAMANGDNLFRMVTAPVLGSIVNREKETLNPVSGLLQQPDALKPFRKTKAFIQLVNTFIGGDPVDPDLCIEYLKPFLSHRQGNIRQNAASSIKGLEESVEMVRQISDYLDSPTK